MRFGEVGNKLPGKCYFLLFVDNKIKKSTSIIEEAGGGVPNDCIWGTACGDDGQVK